MDTSYKTKAIILTRDRLEAHSRVVVFSEDRGKLELVARGTDKLTSKLAAHVEPVSLAEIMVIRGKRQDYVGSAVQEAAYPQLKQRWETAVTASVTLELAHAMISGSEHDERIFALLKKFLETVDEAHAQPLPTIVSLQGAFLFKLMALLGFAPQLQRCASCQKPIAPTNPAFSMAAGGVVCASCSDRHRAIPLSVDAVKLLRIYLREPLSFLLSLTVAEDAIRQTERVIGEWREYHIGN